MSVDMGHGGAGGWSQGGGSGGSDNGWAGYQRLVLKELSDLSTGQQRMEDKLEGLVVDVAMLKVKAGVWGAAAGMIPAAVAILMMTLGGS